MVGSTRLMNQIINYALSLLRWPVALVLLPGSVLSFKVEVEKDRDSLHAVAPLHTGVFCYGFLWPLFL